MINRCLECGLEDDNHAEGCAEGEKLERLYAFLRGDKSVGSVSGLRLNNSTPVGGLAFQCVNERHDYHPQDEIDAIVYDWDTADVTPSECGEQLKAYFYNRQAAKIGEKMSYTGLTDSMRMARKPYSCDSCGSTIPAKTRYSRRTYVLDGELMDEKLHTWCRSELELYLDVIRDDEFEWEWVDEFVNYELLGYGHEPDER